MFASNSEILKTLNILSARHQKEINNTPFSGTFGSPDQFTNIMYSINALETYNIFKKKYQTPTNKGN